MNSPIYLNSPPSFPFIELQEDRQLDQFFIPSQYQASSSLSSSIFYSTTQGQIASQAGETPKDQQIKADMYILHGESSNYQQVFPSSSSHLTVHSTKNQVQELSISKLVDGADEDTRDTGAESGRWISSKMRLMQKMMNAGADKQGRSVVEKFCDPEEDQSRTNLSPKNNDDNNNNVRICSDCNTTKTPLWRSGPQGPKSLCNACGIRKRKARRAMEAAAAARNYGVALSTDNSAARAKGQNKEKKSRASCVPQYKKAPLRAQSGEKVSFEDFAISMSKNSALGRAFPKDEEEAAILLMALSYGLLHG